MQVSFPEFVDEIRDGYSHVVLTQRYFWSRWPCEFWKTWKMCSATMITTFTESIGATALFIICDDGVTRSARAFYGRVKLPCGAHLYAGREPRCVILNLRTPFWMAFARREEVTCERAPRVAFFTDSFHEVNGVALTSREFVRYAAERRSSFLLRACRSPDALRYGRRNCRLWKSRIHRWC